MTNEERKELYEYIEESGTYNGLEYDKESLVHVSEIEINFNKSYGYNRNTIKKARDFKKIRGFYVREDGKEDGGIWAIGTGGKELVVFDVCESSYITNEMLKTLQALYNAKKHIRKNPYGRNGMSYRAKYRLFKFQSILRFFIDNKIRNRVLKFIVYEEFGSKEEKEKRLNREVIIAVKTKAMFWAPSPEQRKGEPWKNNSRNNNSKQPNKV